MSLSLTVEIWMLLCFMCRCGCVCVSTFRVFFSLHSDKNKCYIEFVLQLLHFKLINCTKFVMLWITPLSFYSKCLFSGMQWFLTDSFACLNTKYLLVKFVDNWNTFICLFLFASFCVNKRWSSKEPKKKTQSKADAQTNMENILQEFSLRSFRTTFPRNSSCDISFKLLKVERWQMLFKFCPTNWMLDLLSSFHCIFN